MIKSYTGAVRWQNDTKYDRLRATREGLLEFCVTSDYQCSMMNIKSPHLGNSISTSSLKIFRSCGFSCPSVIMGMLDTINA